MLSNVAHGFSFGTGSAAAHSVASSIFGGSQTSDEPLSSKTTSVHRDASSLDSPTLDCNTQSSQVLERVHHPCELLEKMSKTCVDTNEDTSEECQSVFQALYLCMFFRD